MSGVSFLLDADMPRSSANVFEDHGLDIEDVRDLSMGAAEDIEIMKYAFSKNRIVVSRDKDFGDTLRYPNHPGALILRLPHTFTSEEINERLNTFLSRVDKEDLLNSVTILEIGRYRRKEI